MMKSNRLAVRWLPLLFPAALTGMPDISMEVYRFRTDASSYIEVSLYIPGESMQCDPLTDMFGIEYSLIIADDAENLIAGNRYRLTSTGCPVRDLIDIRRFTLPPGRYSVEVAAFDITDTLQEVRMSQPVEINTTEQGGMLSDIQLLSVLRAEPGAVTPLHKSGLYMEPLPFRLYYPALRQLYLYLETYDTDKLPGQPYIQYTVRPLEKDGAAAIAGILPPEITTYKKTGKAPVSAHTIQLDISSLISGHYVLEATLYDGEKQVQEKRSVVFSRLNPDGDEAWIESSKLNLETSFVRAIRDDSLDYYMRALLPVISSMDVDVMNALIRKGSLKTKRYFIHRYWTNHSGVHAEVACASYMKVARLVDEKYRSGFGFGFETDRGHIFLKYGRPNDIIEVEDEPSAPPYEIWFYNNFPATRQTNVRFIFYNPSLVRNGHKLLHSTAFGEVKNDRWEIELYRDAMLETPGVNERVMGDNVHRNARKYFENY